MEQLKIVFIQCQGMGLQVDGSLSRIPSSVFHENVQNSTAYLIDTKGNILCTILQDRLDYESNQNQDRRIRNKENGFELVWAKDGNCCCVYNNVNRQHVNFSVGRIIIFLLVGMLLGWVISSWIWYAGFQAKSVGDAFMSQSVQEKNQKLIIKNLIIQRDSLSSVIVSKNEQLFHLRDSLSSMIKMQREVLDKEELHIDSIRKVASEKKELLQSMTCDAYSVSKVRVWWNELKQKEKEIVSPLYDFDIALTVYNQFFNLRDEHDLHALYTKGQTVFSQRQLRVINRLIKSHYPENLFRKKLVGMDFHHIERFIGKID